MCLLRTTPKETGFQMNLSIQMKKQHAFGHYSLLRGSAEISCSVINKQKQANSGKQKYMEFYSTVI